MYGLAGAFARVVMVNSSWTCAHIRQIWWNWSDPLLVYPPCDTELLQAIPLDRPLKRLFMVSVAQFRPEKNHRWVWGWAGLGQVWMCPVALAGDGLLGDRALLCSRRVCICHQARAGSITSA